MVRWSPQRYLALAGVLCAMAAVVAYTGSRSGGADSGRTQGRRLQRAIKGAGDGGHGLDAGVIAAAAGRQAACEWCEVLKDAGNRDRGLLHLEQESSRKSSISKETWSHRLSERLPRLAIVVPYRDRASNLKAFVKHMTAFLGRQAPGKFQYWILVLEQSKSGRFNRGKLCNAGFILAADSFDYFIFHDVDKLPEIDGNSYEFPNVSARNPGRKCGAYHLASRVQQFNYRWMEEGFVGGAIMFTRDQFVRIGGMPNFYWGWGGEDDETFDRLKRRGGETPDVCRPANEEKVQRYSSLGHENSGKNGDAIPELAGEDRRRFNCHYEMMKDYREGRRDTDNYTDAAFRSVAVSNDVDSRVTVVTVDICWGNFDSSCTHSPVDAGCNKNRRFG